MAISPPPKKKAAAVQPEQPKSVDEKKIEAIISRGSSTVSKAEPEPDKIKNFNVKILSSQLTQIDQLRAKRPRKPTSPKLGISLQDWILEAIEEKIEREKKKYKST
ncbi:hypothetical protein GCM10023189_37990 [Nibrella saemangeumensis]|uniref:Uncharacterized protein n=1 Tax=Nibrella saemangeumensis TaxID=1084526 RepID=A0ABP8N5Z8_9BACT